MKAFVVSGFARNSHTFLRSDFGALPPGEWSLIDIENLSFCRASRAERLRYALLALLLLARLHVPALGLVLTRRGATALHGLFIAARLLAAPGPRPTEIRSHFLGTASVAAWAFSATTGVPFTIVSHGSDLYSSPRAFDRLLRAARRVECVTTFGKGFVFGRIGEDAIGRVTTRRNLLLRDSPIFDRPVPMRPRQTPSSELRLVGIGRLVPQKDFAFALQVIAELARLRPGKVRYEILGDGPLRPELEALAAQLGLADQVSFLGQMDHSAVLDRLAGADGFLLPCEERTLRDADGLPVVFQEAIALGVPIFCRQAFGVAELLIDGVNGRSFAVDAPPEAWAEGLAELAGRLDPRLVAASAGARHGAPYEGKPACFTVIG